MYKLMHVQSDDRIVPLLVIRQSQILVMTFKFYLHLFRNAGRMVYFYGWL